MSPLLEIEQALLRADYARTTSQALVTHTIINGKLL